MKRIESGYGYSAVGPACIFCGTTTRRLTREHIIARAIGGTMTLASATCAHQIGIKSKVKTCQDITRDIEQFCFRNMLGSFRHAVGFPSNERPTHLSLPIVDRSSNQLIEIRQVDLKDHPAHLMVPTFGRPGLLYGSLGSGNCGYWTHI
jgi:hypothetical protein